AFAKRAMLQTVFPDVFGLPADLVYGLLERIDLLLQRGKEAAKAGAGGGLRTGPILEDLRKARAAKTLLEALLKAANKAKLGGSFRWQQTGFTSLHGTGSFSLASGTLSDVDAVRVVVPGRQIQSATCPQQLPIQSIETTTTTRDTVSCGGGLLQ